MILLLALGIAFLLGLVGVKKKEAAVKFRRCLACFGTLAGCLAALFLVDFLAYNLSPEWKAYKKFNGLRTELLDYGFPDYVSNSHAYEMLGINEDAFALYSSWNFNDPDKFNIEVMEQLVALKPAHQFSANTIISFGETLSGILKNTYTFQVVCTVLFLWLLWGRHDWKSLICMVWEAAVWAVLYLYLYYMGRYGVNRVDVGLWFSVYLSVVYFMRSGDNTERKKSSMF